MSPFFSKFIGLLILFATIGVASCRALGLA
jgi:hypothetical protein